MINAPDYIDEEILIFLYRAQTDALIATQPKISDEISDFEVSLDGFLEVSQKCSHE